MMRDVGHFVQGLSRVRFIPHCGNGTLPSAVGGVFGGVGPFDFTDAHSVISAVPIYLKLDNGAVVSDTLDLSTYTESAITAANFVTAFTAASISGFTASVDSTTGRLKIVSATGSYLQVYGQAAELAGFGMGIGAQIVKTDTLLSLTVVPTNKDDTDISVTDANLMDTTVKIPGYVKGASGVATDTVVDYYLKRIFGGGKIDTDGVFNWPISTTVKPFFMIEIYNQVYSEGENMQGDLIGYQKVVVRKCQGTNGDQTHDQNIRQPTYNYSATNYKTAADVEESAVTEEEITVAEFNALHFDDV